MTSSARSAALAIVALAACRDHRSPADRGAAAPPAEPAAAAVDDGQCHQLDYARDIDLPEASGAAWLPGEQRLIVISDSGNDGAYVELDAAGTIVARGKLPLGKAGDDVEGLALDGATLWGLTSGGWLSGWQRDGARWKLTAAPSAIDPASSCEPDSVNCGANYEGLCLSAVALPDGCDGYAAAKSTGELRCLHRAGAGFTVDATRRYRIAGRDRLADCAIDADGTVWTGDNGFGFMAARQYTVGADGVTLVGEAPLGLGFPEVLALGPDHAVYRFSDLGGSPSLTSAFRCPRGLPKAGPAGTAQ